MKRLVIFGAGGHATTVTDIIRCTGEYEIAAVLASPEDDIQQADLIKEGACGVVAVGPNMLRRQIAERISKRLPEFQFVTLVHPSAVIAESAKLGAGTVVMAGAIVNPDTVIGNHCILNTRASVDHDCQMDDYASIAPGATLGGTVQIGTGSAIGLGANIIHNLKIGEHTVIGAGSTVLHDVPGFVIAYGSPAKVIRDRKAEDNYL